MRFINVADLKDPADPQGRSYREVNAAKNHNIPVGALVEVNHNNPEDELPMDGVRIFVVKHTRDCDQTPLYSLSADPEDDEVFGDRKWHHGFSEDSLTVIRSGRQEQGNG